MFMINRSFFSIKSMTYWMYRLPPPSLINLPYVRTPLFLLFLPSNSQRKKKRNTTKAAETPAITSAYIFALRT